MRRMQTTVQRHFMMVFMCFQVVFLLLQISLFSPLLSDVWAASQRDTTRISDSTAKYKANWESLESRPLPKWYNDAKIGVFIHWGIFSVPSFVGVDTSGLSEWLWYYIRHQGSKHPGAVSSSLKFMEDNYKPGFQYQDFVRDFTAEFFDPDHWADVLESSGAKYVVLTSKHHEGFTLWPSKRSWNWNAVDVGPHRDLLGDLANSVRKRSSLKFGVYHSLYEWYNPLYLDDKENNFTTQTYVENKLMPELFDVVNTYKPEVVWTDGHWEAPCAYWNCTEFIAWLYNQSPVKNSVVTNDRWGSDVSCKHGGYLTCHDRYNPKTKQSKKWENCMTLDRESWGFRRNAKLSEYFTMEQLLTTITQTISYGGNILINIGPTHDGRIPPIFEERLRQLGEWLKVNGEAIYATTEWTTPEDPTQNETLYYTKKSTSVYAILLSWPEEDTLLLSSPVASESTSVTWLGYHEDKLPWKIGKGGKGMLVSIPRIRPSEIPCQWAWVFRLDGLQNA